MPTSEGKSLVAANGGAPAQGTGLAARSIPVLDASFSIVGASEPGEASSNGVVVDPDINADAIPEDLFHPARRDEDKFAPLCDGLTLIGAVLMAIGGGIWLLPSLLSALHIAKPPLWPDPLIGIAVLVVFAIVNFIVYRSDPRRWHELDPGQVLFRLRFGTFAGTFGQPSGGATFNGGFFLGVFGWMLDWAFGRYVIFPMTVNERQRDIEQEFNTQDNLIFRCRASVIYRTANNERAHRVYYEIRAKERMEFFEWVRRYTRQKYGEVRHYSRLTQEDLAQYHSVTPLPRQIMMLEVRRALLATFEGKPSQNLRSITSGIAHAIAEQKTRRRSPNLGDLAGTVADIETINAKIRDKTGLEIVEVYLQPLLPVSEEIEEKLADFGLAEKEIEIERLRSQIVTDVSRNEGEADANYLVSFLRTLSEKHARTGGELVEIPHDVRAKIEKLGLDGQMRLMLDILRTRRLTSKEGAVIATMDTPAGYSAALQAASAPSGGSLKSDSKKPPHED